MAKVKIMFTATLMACPADRISRGQISLGTNHPNGPQDHANAATYAQIKNKRTFASVLDKSPSPLTPNFTAIMAPTAIYSKIEEKNSLSKQYIPSENGGR